MRKITENLKKANNHNTHPRITYIFIAQQPKQRSFLANLTIRSTTNNQFVIRLHPIWIPNFSSVQLKIYFKQKYITNSIHTEAQFIIRSCSSSITIWRISISFLKNQRFVLILQKTFRFLTFIFDHFFRLKFWFLFVGYFIFGNDRLWFNSFANLREKKRTFHIILCLSYLCDQSELVDLIVFRNFHPIFFIDQKLLGSCFDCIFMFFTCVCWVSKKKQKKLYWVNFS